MITERQQKILNALVKEYLETAEPVSSKLLKKSAGLDVCEATIRNELQELTEMGLIIQPHTSAGRVPTNKAYRFFAHEILEREQGMLADFINREIEYARQKIHEEMHLAEKLMQSLLEMSSTLEKRSLPEKDELYDIMIIIGSSKTVHDKNINLINSLIEELKKL